MPDVLHLKNAGLELIIRTREDKVMRRLHCMGKRFWENSYVNMGVFINKRKIRFKNMEKAIHRYKLETIYGHGMDF